MGIEAVFTPALVPEEFKYLDAAEMMFGQTNYPSQGHGHDHTVIDAHGHVHHDADGHRQSLMATIRKSIGLGHEDRDEKPKERRSSSSESSWSEQDGHHS